ncbi:MAG: NUDIX hydrolase [Candidatus Hodarchaeales archaeon]|jgi:8-oxo-dGTP diphosphatase
MVTQKLATLAYIVNQNDVLLLYRNKKKNDFHEGKYVAIGGRLEPGETPLECILREVKEETGYELNSKDLDFRGYIYFDEMSRNKKEEDLPAFNWLVFIYFAQVDEKIIINNQEGELQWFSFDQIPYKKMWAGDKIFTPKILLSGEIIEGKFLYNGEEIVDWTFGRQNVDSMLF